jgi:hypothetical protein
MLPIAMKMSAKLLGADLVSVQPMAAPTGKLFYMDYSYGELLTTDERREKLRKAMAEWRKHTISDV